jgi:hypothetical protein
MLQMLVPELEAEVDVTAPVPKAGAVALKAELELVPVELPPLTASEV